MSKTKKVKLSFLQKITKSSFVIPVILFVIGFFLVSISLFWQVRSHYDFAFIGFKPDAITQLPSNHIQYLNIPKARIYLNVKEATITNGIWQVNDNGASHLIFSANPGDRGNIVVYAHNRANLFGKLPELKKNDLISVVLSDKKVMTYAVEKTFSVDSSAVWVVKPSKKEQLTLYTCTGIFDTKRFVVIAQPVGNLEQFKI